jgi:opacity protein-like surface antigen
MPGCKRRFLLLFACLLIGATGPVCAATPDSPDGWDIDLQLHLWAALPDGTTAGGNNLQIDVLDLLDNVDFFYMGSIGAHTDRWLVLGDVLRFSLSGQDTDTGTVLGRPVDTSLDIGLSGWVLNLVGGYRALKTDRASLDVIFGARDFHLNADIAVAIGNQALPLSGSSHLLDGIIGVRGDVGIIDHWYFSYHLDAGTGDTDSTWQVKTGAGYQLEKLDVVFGYRHLRWNFADNDPGGKILKDLEFRGPYAGVKFVF